MEKKKSNIKKTDYEPNLEEKSEVIYDNPFTTHIPAGWKDVSENYKDDEQLEDKKEKQN